MAATEPNAAGIVDVLVNAAGWALVVWFLIDPDGPAELYERVRARITATLQEQAELVRQLEEIRELPEAGGGVELRPWWS